MMLDKVVVVFGGTGFVGRHVVAALVRRGYGVKIVSRRPERGADLSVLGHVGQVCSLYGDVAGSQDLLERLIGDAHAVVNLAGCGVGARVANCIGVNAKGAENLARAVARTGIKKFIHISAAGVSDVSSSSMYAKSKNLGENAVRKAVPDSIVIRPSLVVGVDSKTFVMLARLIASVGVVFVPYCGLLQPVCIGDLVEAIVASIEQNVVGGVYDAVGSKTYTLKSILGFVADSMAKHPRFVVLGRTATKIAAYTLDTWIMRLILRGITNSYDPVLTVDQAETMRINSVSSGTNLFEVVRVPTSSVAQYIMQNNFASI